LQRGDRRCRRRRGPPPNPRVPRRSAPPAPRAPRRSRRPRPGPPRAGDARRGGDPGGDGDAEGGYFAGRLEGRRGGEGDAGASSEPLKAEQLHALPDGTADRLELVRGRLVREPPAT